MSETLTTALERSAHTPEEKTIHDLIARMGPGLEMALPSQIGVERFTRTILTELRRTPKLYECSPQSLLGAMLLAAQLGLEPGPLGHVYFVPFKGEVAFIIGYRGFVDLAYRSGLLKSISAVTVREGDAFHYRHGTRPVLDHEPSGPPADREPTCYYAVAQLKTGGAPFVVLYPDEIEATKARAPAAKSDLSPWTTDYDAMARKTAIRRLAKLLPQSPLVAQAVERDETPVLPVLDVGEEIIVGDTAGPVDRRDDD